MRQGGQIDGNTVTFTDGNGVCSYSGTVSGDPATSASGDVSCQIADGSGQTFLLPGTWQATR